MKRILSLVLAYIIVYQLSLAYLKNTWITVLLSLIPLLPMVFNIRLNINMDIVKMAAMGIFMEIFLLEPGIAFHKITFHFYAGVLPSTLAYSAITAFSLYLVLLCIEKSGIKNFAIEGLIFGSTVLLFYYPYYVLIDTKTIFSIAVFNIIFIFFLALTVLFIFYKSGFNFAGILSFLFIFMVFTSLSINIDVSKYYYLMWEMITLSLVIFISDFIMKSSFNFKNVFSGNRINLKKALKNSKWLIVIVVIVSIASIAIAPGISDHSYFVIGDPTGSMYPVIKPGSILFVGPIKASSVKVGDIIVFNAPWENGTLFAHQVIRICYIGGHEYFRTKGVANPSQDPDPVPTYDVRGHVLFSIPYLGYTLIYSKIILAIVFVGIAGMLLYPGRKSKTWKTKNVRW
ncbi:MAG: signal peptidase I [Ferroplasma sp.]|uniref:signal peptidase I n=1 Tax=Ferroplasma sp. TaxID=2591003 RepID=UPI002814D574|nr:signal peptidase I [Ferroplasma sp.]WMT51810.1 MAG: signal peptidase I [Ferroplasma sp.]